MYGFPYFKDEDFRDVMSFMESHPLALITGTDAAGVICATHVPLLCEERDGKIYLQGHVMRETDHFRAFECNPNVLAVFSGPNAYVSAAWYTHPHGGSTWNYMTVHVRGSLRFMDDDAFQDFMRRLSLKFEGGDQSSPTVFDNLPQAYKDSLMPAIAGFEICAERIEHTFKLSQNRDENSYKNIIAQLEKGDLQAIAVAEEMKRRKERLFPGEKG